MSEAPRPTRILLVRHGEAHAAHSGTVAGFSCTGLTDEGRRQAAALRDRLARTGEAAADVLYASVMRRAVETAEIIAPALGVADVVEDCDLCEIHVGEADGMAWQEAVERFGPFDFSRRPDARWTPSGESWVEFVERVGARLDRVAEEHAGETVVVACHGGVVDASLVHVLGADRRQFPGFHLFTMNTSLTELHWLPSSEGTPWAFQARSMWRLVRYNDAAHLFEPTGPS